MTKGLVAAFVNSKKSFAFCPDNPPKEITPFLRRILAVTFEKTLTTSKR